MCMNFFSVVYEFLTFSNHFCHAGCFDFKDRGCTHIVIVLSDNVVDFLYVSGVLSGGVKSHFNFN